MEGPQPINHRHADSQSNVGRLLALYFNELAGRPLPLLHDNAQPRITQTRNSPSMAQRSCERSTRNRRGIQIRGCVVIRADHDAYAAANI